MNDTRARSIIEGTIITSERQLVTKRWLILKADDGRELQLFPNRKLWQDFPRKLEGRRMQLWSFTEFQPDRYFVNMATISDAPSQEVLDPTLPYPGAPMVVVDSNENAPKSDGSTSQTVIGLRGACHDLGWNYVVKHLEVGDYLLSRYTCIERKEALADLHQSITDGRLWEQVRELSVYENPILLVEGQIDPRFEKQNWGAIASLLCPSPASIEDLPPNLRVFRSFSPRESVQLMLAIVRREQIERKHSIAIKGKWKADELHEQVLRAMTAYPNWGHKTAVKALRKYESVHDVIEAPEMDLGALVGKHATRSLKRVAFSSYRKAKETRE